MQALFDEILDEVRPLLGQGKVADYIPALADVPADQLGIAVYSAEGELYYAGDAKTPFSIQSISRSPELNQAGNSLIGMAALEKLSQRIGWSIF